MDLCVQLAFTPMSGATVASPSDKESVEPGAFRGLIYLKSEPPLLRYLSQPTERSVVPSSENSDLQELQVYKMMERLGIELGAGVIPRYGLMYVSAVRNCRSCGVAATC